MVVFLYYYLGAIGDQQGAILWISLGNRDLGHLLDVIHKPQACPLLLYGSKGQAHVFPDPYREAGWKLVYST